MARWELLSDDVAREIWDDSLVRCDNYSPFQTYAWGEFRRGLGWEPCHWAAFNDQGEIVAMMLGGLRRYPLGLGLVWAEAAPVGDLSACDESLQKAMRQTTGLKRIYCRFRSDRERRVEDALKLSALGWSRSWSPLTSSYSMSLDLTQNEAELLAGLERNWRRNLRRAWRNKVTVRKWEHPNVEEIMAVYASMEELKGLEKQHSRLEIEHLFKNLKEGMILYRCDDEDGVLLSLRGCVIVGDRASSWLAACNERGRELLASYAVFWGLIQECQRLNMKSLDLGGIDPIVNPGVYQFKKATGSVPIEYLGEWDWASSSWLQWFGNWAISRRAHFKSAEASLKSSHPAGVAKPLFGNPDIREELSQPKLA
jgi:peptidoglycan biosynthesis/recognition FemAB-like protein